MLLDCGLMPALANFLNRERDLELKQGGVHLIKSLSAYIPSSQFDHRADFNRVLGFLQKDPRLHQTYVELNSTINNVRFRYGEE